MTNFADLFVSEDVVGGGGAIAVSDGVNIYTGIEQLNFNGATLAQQGGIITISVSRGTGDMNISVYDSNNDGIVDLADAIAGNPVINQYYGTDSNGVQGFYDLPTDLPRNQVQAIVLAGLTI